MLATINVVADIAFACGVFLLYTQNEQLLLVLVLALASTRLIEQLTGRLTLLIVVTAALAGTLMDLSQFLGPGATRPPSWNRLKCWAWLSAS